MRGRLRVVAGAAGLLALAGCGAGATHLGVRPELSLPGAPSRVTFHVSVAVGSSVEGIHVLPASGGRSSAPAALTSRGHLQASGSGSLAPAAPRPSAPAAAQPPPGAASCTDPKAPRTIAAICP